MHSSIDDRDADTLFDRLSQTRLRIAEAAVKSGREPDAVTLLAVSKTFPAEAVREAVAAGQVEFGENKVQEAQAKVPELPGALNWHLIGPLQKNKIRKALPIFDVIQTVDSLERAQQIDRIAAEEGLFPKIYLQVNIAQDEAKHGFSAEAIRRDFDTLLDLERLHIQGLMTIPAFNPDPEEARPFFAGLRLLRDDLEERSGLPLPGLSMGMSHDHVVAIEEGSTLVRLGTAIFGRRTSLLQK